MPIRSARASGLVGRSAVALLLVAGSIAMPAAARDTPGVQVGYCGSLKDLDAVKAAGFDYIELGVTEIAGLSDADFDAALTRVKASGLPVPTVNLFLPGTIRVTGPAVDPAAQSVYFNRVFPRLQRLGTRIVVFGSGGSRRVPDGFSKDEANAQLVDFGRRVAASARAFGLTIALEPLRTEESNIINTAAEGLRLVTAVNDPNFQMIVDFYHLASEHEDPAIVLGARDHIRHVHMANPTGRVFPLEATEFDYAPFFASLRAIGYNERADPIDRGVSIEARAADFAHDAPRAIALIRGFFSPASPPASAASRAGVPAPAAVVTGQTPSPGRGAGGGGAVDGAPRAAPAGQAAVGPRPNVGPADRPLVDPAAADRGRRVWSAECITCHGALARGTEAAPSLIRSTLVLHDRQGDLVGPFLKKGHPMQSGRPSADLPDADIRDLQQFLRQRVNDTLRGSPIFEAQDVVTGSAPAGKAYFEGGGACTACHSATGDLAGVASRIPSPVDLQQRMLFPAPARGRGAGRGGAVPNPTAITVTLTPKTGPPMSGTLVEEDDFSITFRDAGGLTHVVDRTPGLEEVRNDPLQAHHALLDRITDRQIHDLVAYLVTLQ